MDFATLLEFMKVNATIDFATRRLSLRVGPLTINNIDFPSFTALKDDNNFVAEVLSDQFISRAVMWEDYDRERIDACIGSLRELHNLNRDVAGRLQSARRRQDNIYVDLFLAWGNLCKHAADLLRDLKEDARDPANTGMDIDPGQYIPGVLGDFRRDTYPTVEALIELLPESSEVRRQAAEKLGQGKNLLVREYKVPFDDIRRPDWQITDP